MTVTYEKKVSFLFECYSFTRNLHGLYIDFALVSYQSVTKKANKQKKKQTNKQKQKETNKQNKSKQNKTKTQTKKIKNPTNKKQKQKINHAGFYVTCVINQHQLVF